MLHLCSRQCVGLCRLLCKVHRFGQLLLHVVRLLLLLLLLLLLSMVLCVRRSTTAVLVDAGSHWLHPSWLLLSFYWLRCTRGGCSSDALHGCSDRIWQHARYGPQLLLQGPQLAVDPLQE